MDMHQAVDVPPNMRMLVWLTHALVLGCSALLPGCALFRAPYSDVTLADIRELEQRTKEVVADGDRGRLSLKDSRRFLEQSRAQLGVVRIRGGLNKEALGYLDAADQSYVTQLQRKAPLRTSNTIELRTALSNLHGLGLHHGVWIANPEPSTTTDTDDIPDPPDSKDRDRKHCDDDKHRGRDKDKDCDKKDDKKDKDDDDDHKHH